MEDTAITQAIVMEDPVFNPDIAAQRLALFQEDGTPITILVAEQTGADVALTGYAPVAAAAIDAGDSVNEALAKLEAKADAQLTGEDVLLTGMVSGTNTAIVATDTLNEALAKLQAQIDAINNP